MRRFQVVAALCGALISSSAMAAPANWRASWAAPPAPPMAAGPGVAAERASPGFNNQTVVQDVRLSAGGRRLRVRLTNEYGDKPLTIGRGLVELVGPDGAPVAGTQRPLRFAGQAGGTAQARSPLFSDPVELSTRPLATLRISLYLPVATGLCGCHARGEALAQVSPPGDYVGRTFTPVSTTQNRVFLSGVEVEGGGRGPVVVAFGDSITDGYRSTVGANRRWPDRLAERIAASNGGRTAVVNAGISGNRVLTPGVIITFGESALARFDRDVLAQPGASHLVVLEGVNDLGGQPTPSADAMIGGYRQLIERAHAHGLKVILATILPYKGAAYFRPDGEAARQAINSWIRTGREADGVIDFDAVIRDPADPARMRADLQSGDWLHPNDAGYRAMGEAVPLSLFR